VTATVTEPNYSLDYGFKKSIIVFHTPTTDSDTYFANYFSSVTFETVSLSNITMYNPASGSALFANFPTSITALNLKAFSIDTVDMPLNSESIFEFQNKGTLTVSDINATNIEAVSHSYSTSNYAYVTTVGPLFTFSSFAEDTSLQPLDYSIVSILISFYRMMSAYLIPMERKVLHCTLKMNQALQITRTLQSLSPI